MKSEYGGNFCMVQGELGAFGKIEEEALNTVEPFVAVKDAAELTVNEKLEMIIQQMEITDSPSEIQNEFSCYESDSNLNYSNVNQAYEQMSHSNPFFNEELGKFQNVNTNDDLLHFEFYPTNGNAKSPRSPGKLEEQNYAHEDANEIKSVDNHNCAIEKTDKKLLTEDLINELLTIFTDVEAYNRKGWYMKQFWPDRWAEIQEASRIQEYVYFLLIFFREADGTESFGAKPIVSAFTP
jgi:hypothetical protein